MPGFIDQTEIEIPCTCGRKTKKSIGWIKSNSNFTCACGTVIALDTAQFKREIADVDRAWAEQLADMLAGTVQSRYEDNDATGFRHIASKLHLNRLFFS